MSATVTEAIKARYLDLLGGRRTYIISGATDDQDALVSLLTWLGANQPEIGTVPLQNNLCTVDEVEGLSPITYIGTAVWKVFDASNQPSDSFSIGFDISGETEKIDHSISTVTSAAATGTVPNHQGAINVNEDGSIDGCDHIVPRSSYHVTYTFPDTTITSSWLRGIAGVVGTTNNASFHGFNTRELLLAKVSGQKRPDGLWDVTFEFAVSLNQTSIVIGDVPGVDKKGWELLWVEWESTVSSSNLCKKAKAVYVEQIYYDSTFTTLGIGTTWSGRL